MTRAPLRGIGRKDVEVGARASVSVLVPLLVLLSADRLDLAAYAAFGAFAALYGRGDVYAVRVRSMSIAAIGLLLAVGGGVSLAGGPAPVGAVAVGFAVLMAAAVIAASRFGLAPPAPIFFAFAFLVCSLTPAPPEGAILALGVTASSCVFAVSVALSGWLLRRSPRVAKAARLEPLARRAQSHPGAWRERGVILVIVQILVGSAVAAGIAAATGQGHAYWAVVSVVATVPSPHTPHTAARAVHRTLGTLVGVGVTALILLADPPAIVLVLLVALFQFVAEILVVRHYGAALVAITPLALLMVHLSAPTAPPVLLQDRVVETALGAAVAVLLVLLARTAPVARWLSAGRSA